MKTEQANKQKTAKLARMIERAKAGDQAAYTALYEATREDVYRTVRAMVHSDDMAQDIQQEVYVYAFTHLDSLREPEKLRAWLRSIAVKQSYSALRQATPILFSELGNGEGEELPEQADLSGNTEPELTLERKETARYVNEILDELTDGQRAVVAMYYYEELPVSEIARDLGVTPGTVKTQLFRSRKKIEASVKRLEEKGVKLYGLSPLPFVIALLKRLKPAEKASKKVLAEALSEAGITTETTLIHASAGFFHTLAGKAVIALASVAVIGGGIAAYGWYQSRATEPVVGDVEIHVSVYPTDDLDTPEDYIIDTEPTLPEEETDPAVETVEDSPEDMPEDPTDPEPTDPEPTDPEPTDPEPTDPEPTEPEPTTPQPTTPQPTTPQPTTPQPTDPEPTEPQPTDPEPSEPEPTEPEPSDSESTDPEPSYETLPTTNPYPAALGEIEVTQSWETVWTYSFPTDVEMEVSQFAFSNGGASGNLVDSSYSDGIQTIQVKPRSEGTCTIGIRAPGLYWYKLVTLVIREP